MAPRRRPGGRGPRWLVATVTLVALTLGAVPPPGRVLAQSPTGPVPVAVTCGAATAPVLLSAAFAPRSARPGDPVALSLSTTVPRALLVGAEADTEVAVAVEVPSALTATGPVETADLGGLLAAVATVADGRLTVLLTPDPLVTTDLSVTVRLSLAVDPAAVPGVVDLRGPELVLVPVDPAGPVVTCAVPSGAVPLGGLNVSAPPPPPTTTRPAPPTTVPSPTSVPAGEPTQDGPDPARPGDAPSPPPLPPDVVPDVPPAADPTTASHRVDDPAALRRRLARLEERMGVTTEVLVRRATVVDRLGLGVDGLTTAIDGLRAAAERAEAEAAALAGGLYEDAAGGPGPIATTPGATDEALAALTAARDRRLAQVDRLDRRRVTLVGRRSTASERRDLVLEQRRRLARLRTDTRQALATLRAGAAEAVTGLRFPVGGPHDMADTWLAPRSGGRRHLGTDVFAAEGTPLVAVERGVLADVGTDPLGGRSLWLVGESGTHYYYAHLRDWAPGARSGTLVDAGQVIGYVGHTGNARTTPPHLHLEVHPAGGDAVNPYPLLFGADG